MDKLNTLSQAIRYGSTFIEEDQVWHYTRRDGTQSACALGTAYIAAGLPMRGCFPLSYEITEALSKRFGVPPEVLMDVSRKHFRYEMNRAQCADWLEAQGY